MSEIDSDLVLKRWKPTDPKRPPGQYSVRCEGARGLSVKMHKSGTITWVFRFKQHDKQRQMALGPYPAIPLSAAREAARVAYAHVKAGRDPIEIKRTEEAETIAAKRRKRTFADAVEDYMESGRLTVHRATVWKYVARNPTFPKPIKLSPGCARWRADEIEAWMAERERERETATTA